MTFLVNWRSALGRSILLRKLQRNSVNRQTLALDSIQNIGLVGSGTDTEYAQWTKMTKIKVDAPSYIWCSVNETL